MSHSSLIVGRVDHVAPPLVRDFVRFEKLGKESLFEAAAVALGALFGTEVGERGKIHQAGKALAESAGYGRDGEMADGRRAELRGHEFECVDDVLFEVGQTAGRDPPAAL